MSVLRIALLQMFSCGSNQDANQAKGEAFCRDARAMGADIALFPEMWNVGCADFDPAQAISPNDAFFRHFQALARELDMAIALTYLEKWPNLPRNAVSLIDRHGDVQMTYAKVHTCDFDREAALTPGDGFRVCSLDTALGDVRIGTMICYDREFPESARILMLQGAEIILTPNACTLDAPRRAQFGTRAYENMVGVAMTNYAAPQNNGHSIAFDGIVHAEIDGPARDTLIVEAGECEGVYMAAFDHARLRAYREREAWGNAYRKPHCYGLLASATVQNPFVRPDARR
ncbi:MAG: carbon-nitrogen hydrolase family protein [Armatimonadota bacterium]|nr:carbon-nitrogen hydrolase family protein [Armatimonadota bacterium]